MAWFLDGYPQPPDRRDLEKHLEAVNELSEAGFAHYLPFFLDCLEEDPLGYDMLFHYIDLRARELHGTPEVIRRLDGIAARRFG